MDSAPFFIPGRTYVATAPFLPLDLRPVFECVAVAVAPERGEQVAFGFAALLGVPGWSQVAYEGSQWSAGWADAGPAPDRSAAAAAAAPDDGDEVPGVYLDPAIPDGTLVRYAGGFAQAHGLYRSEVCPCARCAEGEPRYLLRDRTTDQAVMCCTPRASVSLVF
ncbi:hypothetical protein ACIRPK_36685 [Kitasatospora sp. NPDC101801]|uniref:hypothetical protein n=1 Tax=Kitasatospora sp. NPDC101801 TaxID=3364103 RepID=UPI00380596DF